MRNILQIALFLAILFGKNEIQAAQPFVEGKLTGQLGNQMFVIAAATSLALDRGATAVFPDLISDLTNGIPLNFAKVFYHLNTNRPPFITTKYHEPFYHYTPIPYTPNMQIYGYFQSEKYFKNHREEIVQLFAPPPQIREYLTTTYKEILAHPYTVSLHFRSYYDHDPQQKTFIQYGRPYFEKAMSLFPEEALFVVFSNQMETCKRELAGIHRPMVFIEREPHYHDLYLMSFCKHHIICNSSFSWWAAYLNSNPNKIIITPPQWYASESGLDDKDVVPEGWIRLNY